MKSLIILLLSASIIYTSYKYNGSTTSAVTLAGGIIKAKSVDETKKKYKRKDCPVCKGKGWYISGDGIKKVDCGYCEPEKQEPQTEPTQPDCEDGQCETKPPVNLEQPKQLPPSRSIIIRRK